VAEISAAAVKDLRERTGAGMMDCKKALTDASGNVDRAVTLLRERGLAKAAKREGRATAEGVVAMALGKGAGALVELGCETDFVARTDAFQALARELVAGAAGDAALASAEALAEGTIGSGPVSQRVQAAAGQLGENIVIKRVARLESPGGVVGGYVHAGGKLGVLVALRTQARGEPVDALAKDLAMHVAAADPTPVAVDRDGVPAELVAREREVFAKQAAQTGKPEKVIEKIVEGRINKFYAEVTLLEQPFVKDPERSVADVIAEAGRTAGADVAVTGFVRFKLGADSSST
jgi:elongation factor Ts